MMQSPRLERTAQIIAENVVSAFERERDGAGFHPTNRETIVATLVRCLLAVMPTASSDALATMRSGTMRRVWSLRTVVRQTLHAIAF